jgi:hypothetical protein
MSIKLASYLFTGPFPIDTTEVRANHVPVVYAIIAKGGQTWAPVFRVVELGASPEAGLRFADHPRRGEWAGSAEERIAVYLFYAPADEYSAADRQRLAEGLRQQYNPPNGFI